MACLTGCRDLPKDDVLERRWRSYRSDFEELRELVRYPEDKLTKDLCKKLGIVEFNRSHHTGEVILIAQSRGILLNGWDKGYAYCPIPPHGTVPSLPNRTDAKYPSAGGVLYRHLSGKWYLYLQYDD